MQAKPDLFGFQRPRSPRRFMAHMAAPKERIVGSAYTIRAAIDAARGSKNG
ncbi:hypothetical protein NBRC3279_1937 [Acetobacter pasteurianus NBRC 3279]|nr:hypothetical protein NBRC3279_1937 [Acetobacter pasteurianus NBRC 3279]GCD72755.1 hypothetical protein NBRC3284_1911 [Acetobacter pasteurianus NBRC 3284]